MLFKISLSGGFLPNSFISILCIQIKNIIPEATCLLGPRSDFGCTNIMHLKHNLSFSLGLQLYHSYSDSCLCVVYTLFPQ